MDALFRMYGRVFARPQFYKFNRFLYNLSLRGIGVLNWQTEELQGEYQNLKTVMKLAPKGAVVLDVGANNGNFSAAVAGLDVNALIHAFEPHPETFKRLKKRFQGQEVFCHNFGLGDANGTVPLFDYAGEGGTGHASINAGVIDGVHGGKVEGHEIAVRRLDGLIDELGLVHVHLLKIDVEGAELAVLKGLGTKLKSGFQINFVQVEFNEMNVVSRVFLEDLCSVLDSYRVYRILPAGRLLDITGERAVMREIFGFQNLLFSRTKLK